MWFGERTVIGVHRDTILALLVMAGERCTKLMEDKLASLRVRDVQCDEMWGYVGMKEKRKGRERPGRMRTLSGMPTRMSLSSGTPS